MCQAPFKRGGTANCCFPFFGAGYNKSRLQKLGVHYRTASEINTRLRRIMEVARGESKRGGAVPYTGGNPEVDAFLARIRERAKSFEIGKGARWTVSGLELEAREVAAIISSPRIRVCYVESGEFLAIAKTIPQKPPVAFFCRLLKDEKEKREYIWVVEAEVLGGEELRGFVEELLAGKTFGKGFHGRFELLPSNAREEFKKRAAGDSGS